LFEKGGRSREFDWRLPGELREPLFDRFALKRRLVDVGDRDFERQGLLPELFGDPCQQYMSSVYGVERTWQQYKGSRRRQQHLTIGLGGDAIELAGQQLIDRIYDSNDRLRKVLIGIEQAAWRGCRNPACMS